MNIKEFIVKLLALALTNLVLDLTNLVTNMAKPSLVTNLNKPSLNLDKIWARSRHYNQTDNHHHPSLNFSKVETWNSYSLTVQNLKGENWIDTIIK